MVRAGMVSGVCALSLSPPSTSHLRQFLLQRKALGGPI
jgi:hypothetical protein